MDQLFDGVGKLLQGLANALSPYLQLAVAHCSQVLVPKVVLEGLDGLLRHFFRWSVEDISSLALQGSKQMCNFYSVPTYSAMPQPQTRDKKQPRISTHRIFVSLTLPASVPVLLLTRYAT